MPNQYFLKKTKFSPMSNHLTTFKYSIANSSSFDYHPKLISNPGSNLVPPLSLSQPYSQLKHDMSSQSLTGYRKMDSPAFIRSQYKSYFK